jgi:hypothetical protein
MNWIVNTFEYGLLSMRSQITLLSILACHNSPYRFWTVVRCEIDFQWKQPVMMFLSPFRLNKRCLVWTRFWRSFYKSFLSGIKANLSRSVTIRINRLIKRTPAVFDIIFLVLQSFDLKLWDEKAEKDNQDNLGLGWIKLESSTVKGCSKAFWVLWASCFNIKPYRSLLLSSILMTSFKAEPEIGDKHW